MVLEAYGPSPVYDVDVAHGAGTRRMRLAEADRHDIRRIEEDREAARCRNLSGQRVVDGQDADGQDADAPIRLTLNLLQERNFRATVLAQVCEP